ncbi:MAG: hypothetical protein RLZZ303_884, partial [Candidatus Hydrogenedentota bacterium]
MPIDRKDTPDSVTLAGVLLSRGRGARQVYWFLALMLTGYAGIEVYRRSAYASGAIDTLARDVIGLLSFVPLLAAVWGIRGQLNSTPRIRDLLLLGLVLHVLSQGSDVLQEFTWAAS